MRERAREAAFVTAETAVFVSQHHGGIRATNVKQTKTRGSSVRRCAHARALPFGGDRVQENEVTVRSCPCWRRMQKQACERTMQLCASRQLHAGSYASTQTRTMDADRLWLVPLQQIQMAERQIDRSHCLEGCMCQIVITMVQAA